MTKTQTQKNFNYSVTVNINNEIRKTYYFNKKSTAYFFLLNGIKPLVKMITSEKPTLVSASCFKHENDKTYLLSKKNLTEINFK